MHHLTVSLLVTLSLLLGLEPLSAHPASIHNSLAQLSDQATAARSGTVEPSQQQPDATAQDTEPTSPTDGPEDQTRVTVLGYHEFSGSKKATAMLLPTDKFRQQMQAIKDLGLNVISMEEFLAWKAGKKSIQDKSVLITIDDGWKSVYTDAYPILKEFGFPFTVFLYTNYVDGGGSALTTPMIREMQQHGCHIGCHSISHPYPSKIRDEQKKGEESFIRYLKKEMGDSKQSLESGFKQAVTTYAYPGGFVTEEMIPVAQEAGYQCLFTVLPGKVSRASNDARLPRYVILGTHDYIFRNATSFKATSSSDASDGAIVQSTPHPVHPAPGKLTPQRQPLITANLADVDKLDPESIVMRVAGFGRVPASYDPETQIVSWQVSRKLRSRHCEVSVQWKLLEEAKYQKPMTWTFRVNRKASYQIPPTKVPTP